MDAHEHHRPFLVALSRPSLESRWGIRLYSETLMSAPAVQAIAAVAAASQLAVGDVLLEVDDVPTTGLNSASAAELFKASGTELKLLVRRPGLVFSHEEEKIELTIQRNRLGLGLVVDALNVVDALAPGSAAAEHGSIKVGDRVVAIAGKPVASSELLAHHVPAGPAAFSLTLHRPIDSHVIVSPRASRREGEAAFKPAPHPLHMPEIEAAFAILGGTDTVKIGAGQVLAALSHFQADYTLSQARQLCNELGDDESLLNFSRFSALMAMQADRMSSAHRLFDAIDRPGHGFVRRAEVRKWLAHLPLERNAVQVGSGQTAEDVESMLGMLGDAERIERNHFVDALQQLISPGS